MVGTQTWITHTKPASSHKLLFSSVQISCNTPHNIIKILKSSSNRDPHLFHPSPEKKNQESTVKIQISTPMAHTMTTSRQHKRTLTVKHRLPVFRLQTSLHRHQQLRNSPLTRSSLTESLIHHQPAKRPSSATATA